MIGFQAPLALAFAAGMVATVNPCGFAMLPAYLSYFLGVDDKEGGSPTAGVVRAVRVGLAVSAGFLALFAVIGAIVEWSALRILQYTPWISIVIGLALVALGIAMLRGFELTLRLPRLQRGGSDDTDRSMFVFGVSYATVSLGCTLPTFLSWVSGTTKRESALSGIAAFGAYAVGTTLVLLTLTVSLALARRSLVTFLRRSQQYVNRVAGAIVAIAGAYVAYYGWYELRTLHGDSVPSGPVDVVTGWSDDVQGFIRDAGPTRVGLLLALLLAGILTVTIGVRSTRAR
jgi:cytochrome c biogenesis protein CcdA